MNPYREPGIPADPSDIDYLSIKAGSILLYIEHKYTPTPPCEKCGILSRHCTRTYCGNEDKIKLLDFLMERL
jgi:ribosomal protein S27AE